jgi:hypothetical protein
MAHTLSKSRIQRMKLSQKKLLLLSSLILLKQYCNSQTFQNLVINGGFETYTQCPVNSSKIDFAPPWKGPTTSNTTYLNACSPQWNVPFYGGVGNNYYYLPAKEGLAYASIFIYHSFNAQDFRTFAQGKLSDSLDAGKCYYVEFFASNLQWVKYRCNNVAASFLKDTMPYHLTVPGIIPNILQHVTNYGNPLLEDTVKWVKISGIYESTGGEKYVAIGNFKSNMNTDTANIYPIGTYPYSNLPVGTDIFIDAVSVYNIDPNGALPWSYRDTTIDKGDSVYIGNKMGGLNFHPQWFTQTGNYIATNAGITVSPTITTKYYVQYTLCGVQRTDTVKVTVPPDEIDDTGLARLNGFNAAFKMYPLPAGDELNLTCEAFSDKTLYPVRITDQLGQVLREEWLFVENKKATISTSQLSGGIYFLQLVLPEGTVSRKIVISRE